MSDDKLDLKLNVDVDVHDADKAKALREELARIDAELTAIGKHTTESLKALGMMARAAAGLRSKGSTADAGAHAAVEGERDLYQELKRRFAFERRMASQRKAEENDAARAAREEAREAESRFRAQMAWNTRIAAQRAREERAAETEIQRGLAETARIGDRNARKALADAKALQREQAKAQEKAAAQINRGAGQVRGGVGHAVVAGGATAGALVYGGKRTLDRLTRSGVDIDAAMNANARMEIGLSPKEARAKVEGVRENYKPLARRLGQSVAELLRTRSESLQAGVDSEIVDSVVENATKYAILNGLNPSDVAESSGYGLTALSAHGKVTKERAANLFNKQQYLAATTAASRQGLASFVRRGLAAGAMAGFSDDDSLAYGAAGTAAGADGESVARALSSTQERLAMMPTRAAQIARKHNKTLQDRLLLQLPKKLGFSGWKDIKQAFSADAAGTTDRLYQGLGAIQDPRERLELAETLFGKEFGSMHAGMAAGGLFHKMRESVRSKEAGGALDAGMAIEDTSFPMIMKQIGATLTELMNDLGLELKQYWSDLRDWIVKTPKAFQSFQLAFREGLRGFVTGLGSPDGTMSGLLKSWMGDPGSFQVNAAAVGSFAKGVGQGIRDIGEAIVGFVRLFAGRNASPEEMGKWSARILGLSAALLVAAPAVAVLGGLATAISGFATVVLGVWGAMKAAGLVGSTGAGAAPKIAGTVAGGGLVGRMFSFFSRFAPALAMPLTTDASKEDQDRLTKRLGAFALELEKQRKALEKNTEAVEEGAKIQKQSYRDNDFRSLIHKASFNANSDAVNEAVRSTARAVVSGSVGSGGGSDGPALSQSIPGKSISGMGGRRNGIIGRGTVPSIPDSVPMSPTERNQLGLILQHESGGRNVMNGVGARTGVSPTAPRGYTAQGYYQMLNSNWRRIAPGLGIKAPNAMAASFEDQTRVALHLLRHGGIQNWSNFNPKLRAALARGDQASFAVPGVGGDGGGAGPAPGPQASDGQSTGHLDGKIQLEGETYDFGSGGHQGANSIPFGTHKITPGTIGPWGQAHGALGIAGNAIWDKTLGRMRTGIEFHAASSASKLSAGCVAISRAQYAKFRAHVLDYVRRNGEAYLTVGADGRASITSAADRLKADTARTQEIAREAGKAPASLAPKPTDAKDDLVDRHGGGAGTITNLPGQLGTNVPIRGGEVRNMGGGGSGHTIHQTVNINGHNQSPQELAGQVQRHLQDSMNRRTHDYDGFA